MTLNVITGKQLELLRAAVEIEQADAKQAGAVGYSARLWAQMALPYRDPGQIPAWIRRNGKLTLKLTPGLVELPGGEVTVAYPFGVVPRLLMVWMATEAVRLRDRELVLGPTLSAFMRDLGLTRNGQTISRLRIQVQRLAHASVQVMDQREQSTRTESFHFASATDLWLTPKDGQGEALWPSTITLSHEFFESIVHAPVPVDLRALTALRAHGGGGLPIDMYTWLAHRMSYLQRSTLVPWAGLAAQFGSQYSPGSQRFFKRDLLKTLPKVLAVYPTAKVTSTADGLLLSPSPTPVGPRR